jgi:hypothetical protein
MKQYFHDTNFIGISVHVYQKQSNITRIINDLLTLQGPVHFDNNGVRVMTELRMLQYRTTFINGTAILGDLTSSTAATLDQKLRLIDIAYIEENETSLNFLDGSKNDVWPGIDYQLHA